MSSKFWHHFISNGGSESFSGSDPLKPDPDETAALDAYSSVVVRVAERLRPAVVNLHGGRGRRHGSGSGVVCTPDGFLPPTHHVVQLLDRVRVRLASGG